MKRILCLIGLKFFEIGSIVFGPYYLGLWNPFGIERFKNQPIFWTWVGGVWHTLFIVLGVLVVLLIWFLLMANWEWACRICAKEGK